MSRRSRRDRRGMILLNVLLMVAIAAAAVTVMVASQDIEVQRTVRIRDAAQAQAYGRAGELSAIVALRRDGLTAPTVDAYSEPWAAIAQRPIAVPGGRFALAIEDEQARFNLNSLSGGDAIAASRFARIAGAVGVSPPTVARIGTLVGAVGPIADEGLLRTAGVDPADLDRLRPYVAFLPKEAQLNLNTAQPPLLTILLDDQAAVRLLIDRRTAKSVLDEADLAAAAVTGLGGLTSDHFLVTTAVTVGEVTQTTRVRLARSSGPEGVRVAVTSRRRAAG